MSKLSSNFFPHKYPSQLWVRELRNNNVTIFNAEFNTKTHYWFVSAVSYSLSGNTPQRRLAWTANRSYLYCDFPHNFPENPSVSQRKKSCETISVRAFIFTLRNAWMYGAKLWAPWINLFFLREISNLVNNIVWYQYQGLQTNFK